MTVQLDGAALTMPKAQFVDAYLAHPHLRNLVDRYQSILLMQAQQNAACHALHSVRSRLCPLAPAIPRHDWKRDVQPDPGISFSGQPTTSSCDNRRPIISFGTRHLRSSSWPSVKSP